MSQVIELAVYGIAFLLIVFPVAAVGAYDPRYWNQPDPRWIRDHDLDPNWVWRDWERYRAQAPWWQRRIFLIATLSEVAFLSIFVLLCAVG